MNYPSGMRSSYRGDADYRCRDENCETRFSVPGVYDMGNFWPDDEPCCPECKSFDVR